MPEDTILYVFRDNDGRWIASPDESEAKGFVTSAFRSRSIERMTLAQLYARDPRALVRAREQYYWASDLVTGIVRGGEVR